MTNKQIQLDILNNASELISLCKELNYLKYKQDIKQITNDEATRLLFLQNQLDVYPIEYTNNAFNIVHSQYKKKTKLYNKITKMLSLKEKYLCDVLFLTMTFEDNIFNTMTQQTRKRNITRFLKECFVSYIANIDFGEKNGREHYHAVVLTKNLNYKSIKEIYNKRFKKSNIKIEQVYYKNSDIRIAKYITKLSSHAFKETTKREHILYSKNDLDKINQLEPINKIKYETCDNMIIVKDNEPLPFEARTDAQISFKKRTKYLFDISKEYKLYCKENNIKNTKYIPHDQLWIIQSRVKQKANTTTKK